jgi:hypothetical protein
LALVAQALNKILSRRLLVETPLLTEILLLEVGLQDRHNLMTQYL